MANEATILSLSVGNWIGIFAVVVGVFSWFVSNKLSSKRDFANKQSEIRLNYLIEAYDAIAMSSQRPPAVEYDKMIEAAIAKIQLFGTTDQIALVHQFVDNYGASGVSGNRPQASVDDLLFSLRNQLRAELRLAPVGSHIKWIRIRGAPLPTNSMPPLTS
jgi:hypothetical protein